MLLILFNLFLFSPLADQLSPVLQENDYFTAAPPTNVFNFFNFYCIFILFLFTQKLKLFRIIQKEYDYVQNFQPESALSNPQSSQFGESVQFK